MIRHPELKKQAAILAAEIALALNVPLQQAVALEIVAKLNGFKNWRHAASTSCLANDATVSPPASTTAATATAKIQLAVVFGSEDRRAANDSSVDASTLETYELMSFGTEAEKAAYLKGLFDMDGWTDYAVVTDHFAESMQEYAPGEDGTEIRKELAKQGFVCAHGFLRGDCEEFNRGISAPTEHDGEQVVAYQFVIFQKDEAGTRFVNMDCARSDNGDYLTETPIFTGSTVLEALQNALKTADAQRDAAILAFLAEEEETLKFRAQEDSQN